jgi:Leucine-rich repeat (LRR) protein
MGMKQILGMIAVVVLVGQSVVADEKLIADPIVEKVVLLSLEKPEGELTEADLENVTALVLRRTKITDAGLKEVAKLRGLTYLDLVGTKITDAGLKEVAKLQKLTILDLDFTKITKTGVAELRKALPNCNIIGL